MTLQANTRLGPYEILALVGAGGMGEVYRAHDTRLNRDVAIKILPPAVAAHPTRRTRFAREARSVSQLSHPHICTIHDVGRLRVSDASAAQGEEVDFLVMEYIEGESLEKRLRLGPLPWATALEWAIQIAGAIDAAHRRGIIHRDLKPANIMVAGSGMKLLDFGLAKLLESTAAASDGTATESITAEQKLIGTLHYMSPEQLEGRDVDARTDVFAFGVTLYEMVTGRKAFTGASAASVSVAILTSEPAAVSSSAAGENGVPPGLDHIIRRALAKHPDERWQTARDLMLELRWLKDGRPRPATTVSSTRRGPRWLAVAAGAAAVALLAGTLGWRIGLRQRDPERRQPVFFTIGAPPGMRLSPGPGILAVAPDGRKIAFIAGPDGGTHLLWWQSLNSPVAHALPGTEEAHAPFWSPDSHSVGFSSQTQLKRVRIDGGTPVVITDHALRWMGGNRAAFWSRDDTIVFQQTGGLFRVKATGGEPPVALSIDGGMPRALPGDRLLYQVSHQNTGRSLEVQGPGLAAPIDIPVASNAVFASGYLVFREGQALVAQPFDDRAVRLTGRPTTIVEDVFYNPAGGRTLFDVSEDLLAYRVGDPGKLTWRERDGQLRGSIGEIGDMNPAIAPDGSVRVGVDRWDSETRAYHVSVIDAQDRSAQLTTGAEDRWATWSPDGKWIVQAFANGDSFELRRQSADGRSVAEILLRHAGVLQPLDYSANGQFLVYQRQEARPSPGPSGAPRDGDDLWALPLAGDDKRPLRITNTPAIIESSARLSPDVRWIAYSSDEGGQANVWVQEFPGGVSPRQKISVNGGLDPSWRADGKELYYVAPDGALMAVPVTPGPVFTFGTPVVLFKFNPGRISIPLHLYSATPDGQRFLVSERSGAPWVITVVVNWTSLLR